MRNLPHRHPRTSHIRRLTTVVVALACALGALGAGCDIGDEGQRCNPDLSHDECNAPLTCQQPVGCAENYCCPANLSASTNPYCNGQGCPGLVEAGQAAEAAAAEAAAGEETDSGPEAPSDGPSE